MKKKYLMGIGFTAFGLGLIVGILLLIRSKLDWEIMSLIELDEQNDLGCPYTIKRSKNDGRKP